MQVELVNISVVELQTLLCNALEPIKQELEETKATVNLLTEKHLTTKELAELFNTSEQTIRAKANQGKIPHYMFGSEMRFKISEVKKAMVKVK